MTTRRAFLAGLAAAALPRPGWADVGAPACLSAGKLGKAYVLHGLNDAGQSLFQIPLPARGHAAAAHPDRALAVAFARRPGTFALVIDCASGTVLHRLIPPEGRQFNGHGVFSADGAYLMTSEVEAETSEGRIGVWQLPGFRRVDEWPSGGIGPHDIKRLPDGRLVVANGGIATNPMGRDKLNLDRMRPNLGLLSPSGALLERVELTPEYHQNSIRHLALLGEQIAFAMQWEGPQEEPAPLLGLWTPGTAPRLCPPPEAEAFAMKGYAGSIAASPAAGMIAVTSAPGGVVMLFDGSGKHLATHRRGDISGVALADGGFLASDGQGAVWACDASGLSPLARHETLWDNHLVSIG